MNQSIRILKEFIARVKEDHVSAYATQAAFFLILSLFPFLILMIDLTRFLPIEPTDLMNMLQVFLPDDIEVWMLDIVSELFVRTGSTWMVVSIITTLWSASRGILSISNGLNSVYRTEESRNYFVLRGIATFHTMILAVALVLLVVVFVFGNALYQVISVRMPLLNDIATLIISIRVAFGFALLFFMFVAMYKELPNHRITFKQAAPGALFASVSWIVVSFGFSVYINHISDYSRVYGSLAGIAIAMVWMYLMMNLVLWGGEINKYMMEQYPELVASKKVKKLEK